MSWWNWGGIPARVWLKLDDGSDTGQLIFGSSYDVRFPTSVYEYDPDFPNDYLNGIPYSISTPEYDCGEPWSTKRFEFVTLDFDDYNGGITVSWEVDGGIRSGSFEANVPVRRTNAYGSGDDITAMYNDATATVPNGGFYAARKAYSMNFKLPQEARGKRISFTFSADASGFTPGKLNVVAIGYSDYMALNAQGAK